MRKSCLIYTKLKKESDMKNFAKELKQSIENAQKNISIMEETLFGFYKKIYKQYSLKNNDSYIYIYKDKNGISTGFKESDYLEDATRENIELYKNAIIKAEQNISEMRGHITKMQVTLKSLQLAQGEDE